MASSISPSADEHPPKRQKLSSSHNPSTSTPYITTHPTALGAAAKSSTRTQIVMSESGFQPDREEQVGISHFVNTSNVGFTGVLKQRYAWLSSTRARRLAIYGCCHPCNHSIWMCYGCWRGLFTFNKVMFWRGAFSWTLYT